MKILFLDIETSPTLGYFWGIFKQNIGINQIVEEGSVISFAAKWYGKPQVIFDSVHQSDEETMLEKVHDLLEEADVVVHFNGQSFDVKHLNKEFLKQGWGPPAPFKQVDLLRVWKKNFYSISNKFQWVSQIMGIGEKIKTDFDLWKGCMDGDAKSWADMKKYNIQDTMLLEKAYVTMLPWITNHPNHALYSEKDVCSNCGSGNFKPIKKPVYTATKKYVQYRCADCGAFGKSIRAEKSKHQLLTKGV